MATKAGINGGARIGAAAEEVVANGQGPDILAVEPIGLADGLAVQFENKRRERGVEDGARASRARKMRVPSSEGGKAVGGAGVGRGGSRRLALDALGLHLLRRRCGDPE